MAEKPKTENARSNGQVKRYAAVWGFVAIVAIVVYGGVLHGSMTNRWGVGSEMQSAGERLAEIPAEFGPWKQVESREFDESTKRELQPAGYIERTYLNENTGERIGLMMVVGRVGPISVHTPEVCVGSQRYDIAGKRQKVAFESPDALGHSVWSVAFRARSVDGHVLQTYYGWSLGGPWMAADDPRLSFAGQPYLYKVQLTAVSPPRAVPTQSDVGQRFLRDLLPVAQKCLIQPSANSSRATLSHCW
jgi:hypothetical protein